MTDGRDLPDAASVRRVAASAPRASADLDRADHRLPGLPAAGGLAGSRSPRSSGCRSATRPIGAEPVPGFGPDDAPGADRRTGARRARRQPHRPDVHRRPQRRRAVRRTAPDRFRVPAGVTAHRRRPDADRTADHRAGALRAAGQQADPGRVAHLRAVPGSGTRAAGADASGW